MTTDPRDAEQARLTAELFEMTRSRDEWRNDFRALEKAIVGDTGLSAMTVAVQARLFRPRAEKAEAERDAALAQVAGDGYRLQKQHWFVETGWVDSGGQGYWIQTKESVEVATEAEAKSLQDQWLAEGKLQNMSWGEIRPTFSYGLFRIRSEWRNVSPADALAALSRRDAQMRAEGRKEGLREAGWQPIETASNDASIIVAYDNGVVALIQADDNDYDWSPYRGYPISGIQSPTHWIPLPEPLVFSALEGKD